MIALIMLLLASTPAMASSCGERLQGYTVYELLENGAIERHHSTFPIDDWSDASAFDGVITPASAKTSPTLEVVLITGKRRIVTRSEFAAWEIDSSFARAKDFSPEKFFKDSKSGDSFILRLKEDGKTICEERHEISDD